MDIKSSIKQILARELVKKEIKEYFEKKGIDLSEPLYPPAIQDIAMSIPRLVEHIEIVPFVDEIDPVTGLITLGWNLYALGTIRMFLGRSSHKSMNEVHDPSTMLAPKFKADKITTPSKVIKFLSEQLSKHKINLSGDVATLPRMGLQRFSPDASSRYYNSYSERFKPQFY